MTYVVWEDPPAAHADRIGRRNRPSLNHDLLAAILRTERRRWARVHETDEMSSLALRIRGGRLKAYRPIGAFEAAQRLIDGRYVTYARYVGGPS